MNITEFEICLKMLELKRNILGIGKFITNSFFSLMIKTIIFKLEGEDLKCQECGTELKKIY